MRIIKYNIKRLINKKNQHSIKLNNTNDNFDQNLILDINDQEDIYQNLIKKNLKYTRQK